MRKSRKIYFIVTLAVAMMMSVVGTALADTGVGNDGSITVLPACLNGEPAREISITADANNGFVAPLHAESADGTAYVISTLRAYYAPGDTLTYVIPVSEHDADMWRLFSGWDGDIAFQAAASSPAGECNNGGGDKVYPSNVDGVKGNSNGECKAVLVHVDGAGVPSMTVVLDDGTSATEDGWMTGRAWHFAVDYDRSLTPVDAWVNLNGSSPYPDHDPRLNLGRC